MTTTELVLPSSVNPETWNPDTAAMMEFAGLTWFENGVRVFAPSGIMAGFINACKRTGLDPTAKQIYAAVIGGKWTVLVGVDGMRVVAQRTGEYDGQDPIEWQAEQDGPWSTTPGPGTPYAARISIYRKNIGRPLVQTVTFKEFGGTGGNWTKRPSHMLGIRAETHGFRRLFPQDLSGLYTAEDFDSDSIDTSDALVIEASENWAALIETAKTKDDITAVVERAKAANEFTDIIRTKALTRYGMLSRAEEAPQETPEQPSAPRELSEAEFEGQSAAEFDAQAVLS
jgi:hypothetical protein